MSAKPTDAGGASETRGPLPDVFGRVGPGKRVTLLCLIALMLLGLGLRVYRLGDQSVWLDEFLSICNLHADSPLTPLRFLKIYAPEQSQAPVFYFLLYYWSQIFGTSAVALRLLPVTIGVLCIPLFYGFVRFLFGHRVALVAALCYTLSPQHIWHAQEPRPYTLLTPLVIMALYALLRALRDRRLAWWAVNLVINTLLVWTQVLTALFILVQGLFMLVFFRRMFWRMTAWGIMQLILLIPWTVWMLNIPYVTEFQSDSSVSEIAGEVLLDDIVSYHSDILPPYKTNPPEFLSPLAKTILPLQPIFDTLFAGVIVLSIAFFVLWILQGGYRRRRNQISTVEADRRFENGVLFMILLIVPGAILGGLAMYLKRPLVGPMYAMYSTISIYIALGLLIAALRPRVLYALGIGILMVLYGFQLALVLPEITRSDWKGVAQHLERNGAPTDLIVDVQFNGNPSFLPYNWESPTIPIAHAWTYHAAVEKTVEFLDDVPAGEESSAHNRAAWIIHEEFLYQWLRPDTVPAEIIERALSARNIEHERIRFPGHYNLVLIRAWVPAGRQIRMADEPVPMFIDDYETVLHDLRLEAESDEVRRQQLNALRGYIAWWPPILRLHLFFQACTALADGEPEIAEAFSLWMVDMSPEFGLGHFALGLCQAARSDPEAVTSFERALALHGGLKGLVQNYVDALVVNGDTAACLEEVRALERTGFVPFADAMREACFLRAGRGTSD
jgi:hypothetical protein